jgi:hypothetical protein
MANHSKITHVIPMGLEIDRVIGGIRRFPSNHVIFVYSKNRELEVEQMSRENAKKIKETIQPLADVEEIELDYHDFKSSFKVFNELFRELKDEGYEVYFNTSAGTRVVSSAGLIAAFLTGVNPYYVIPETYELPEGKTVLSTGVRDVKALPVMDVTTPKPGEVIILRALGSHEGRIEKQVDLIPTLESMDFFDEKGDIEDDKDYKARQKSKLSQHLKNMRDKGFVKIEKRGKYDRLNLTESGELFSLI